MGGKKDTEMKTISPSLPKLERSNELLSDKRYISPSFIPSLVLMHTVKNHSLTWSLPLVFLRNSSTASTACWKRLPLLIFIISSLWGWYGFSCSTLIQALEIRKNKLYSPNSIFLNHTTSRNTDALSSQEQLMIATQIHLFVNFYSLEDCNICIHWELTSGTFTWVSRPPVLALLPSKRYSYTLSAGQPLDMTIGTCSVQRQSSGCSCITSRNTPITSPY